jgi:hypothetical protein
MAEIGMQLSINHHYWKSGVEKPLPGASFGLGLAYYSERLYYSGSYTFNHHTFVPEDEDADDDTLLPMVEADIAVGYHILTNLSAFVGYRYQNINYDNADDSSLNFYESGHGLGIGVKLNQIANPSWIFYQGLTLSTLWMDNDHAAYNGSGYQDYSFNLVLGALYRLSQDNSLSMDITYKGSSLDHGMDEIGETRSYWKTGLNLIVVF